MFGYLRPYEADLTEYERKRYRAVYCGLCRALKERYGLAGRMGLNFDMTFLILLLNSLYEPKETRKEALCPPHPVKSIAISAVAREIAKNRFFICNSFHHCPVRVNVRRFHTPNEFSGFLIFNSWIVFPDLSSNNISSFNSILIRVIILK